MGGHLTDDRQIIRTATGVCPPFLSPSSNQALVSMIGDTLDYNDHGYEYIMHRMSILSLVIIALLLCPRQTGAHQPALVLPADITIVPLSAHLSLLRDPGFTWTVAEVATVAPEDFAAPGTYDGGGFRWGADWYRLVVRRARHTPRDWILEIGPPYLDDVRVYVERRSGGWHETRTGDHVPRTARVLGTASHAMSISLPDTRPLTLFIRVQSRSVMLLEATLYRPPAFSTTESLRGLVFGAYLGGLAILIVVYSLVATWIRDLALIYYAAYVGSLIIMHLGLNGTGGLLFPTAPGWVFDFLVGGGTLLGMSTVLVLWDKLLDMSRYFPIMHRAYYGMAVVFTLLLPLSVSNWYRTLAPFLFFMVVVILFLTLSLVILSIRKRGFEPTLQYYTYAYLVTIAASIIGILQLLGHVPRTFWTAHLYQMATGFHVVLLAVGLSHRIRDIQEAWFRAEEHAHLAFRRAAEQRNFVAMLSHEFRSPLSAIDKAAQSLELNLADGAEVSRMRRRLTWIRESTGRLAEMVDLFLSSQALEDGNFALDLQDVAIEAVIGDVRTRLQHDDYETRLVETIGEPDIRLRCDAEMLAIALGNVIGNALKYAPPDTPVLLTVEKRADQLVISVQDSGPGMTAEEVDRIGTMYFRATSSVGTKGAGVGLYIALRILQAHHGNLTVESEPSNGTNVSLYLPLAVK